MKFFATSLIAGVASLETTSFIKSALARGWEHQGPVSDDTRVELTFAIKQQNLDKLLDTFHKVSNPDHAMYGQHMTFDEVNALTSPQLRDVAIVATALQDMDARNVRSTVTKDFLMAEVTVAAAERVFGGDYLRFRHSDGRTVLRNPSAVLSSGLSASIDFVMPLNEMIGTGGGLRVQANTTSPNAIVNTPGSLKKLYNVDDAVGSFPGNKQAFTGFLEQYWTNTDLKAFNAVYNRKGSGEKPSKQVGDGKTGAGRAAGAEAELDVQYMMSMGLHVNTEFWSFTGRMPDNDQNEPFLKFLYTLSNTSDAPYVISTSYGEDEDSMTIDYQKRCNVEFQKAGVRGISLLFASGDSGVGGAVKCSDQCEAAAQGTKCLQSMWPAASPYVTAVGGTTGAGAPEKAASLSSGGFSYRWETPEWQRDAVAAFLNNTDDTQPDASLYPLGRGYPDISAQAMNYMVFVYGLPTPVAGTSAASPTAGGILSLVNDKRLAAGQSPLGFMNPLLYKNAGSLNDVVGGCNPGCGSKGFCAVAGWDPVTGLGTPNYKELVKLSASSVSV